MAAAVSDPRPVLVYCRESRDEQGAAYGRIETQRDILLDFCRRRGLTNIVEVVLDDDTSGTSFRRLDPVVERVRRGEVQVLVFKDASRLGRNLKESLIFVERMESCGAEILFESEEYDEDFFPLKAWFNEQRAKEDSRKIRRVLRHKMESGTLLVKPCYGYRRGEENLPVPDPETGPVVQWIFQQVQAGRGPGEIAEELNRNGIPTPSQAAGLSRAAAAWTARHIRRIVENPVYTGTMVYNRSGKQSYKNKRTVRRPPEAWIVQEDHHEALVSQALFESVQRTRRTYHPAGSDAHPFSGLLRCGRCGSPLVLRSRKGRPPAYLCGRNHRLGTERGCSPHHVREDQLLAAAREYLAVLLRAVPPERWEELRRRAWENGPDRQLRALEEKLAQTRRRIDRIYEDRLAGVIPESLFLRKYGEHAALQTALEERVQALQRREGRRELTEFPPDDIINYSGAWQPTGEQLRMLFEEIVVYEPGELGTSGMDGPSLPGELAEEVRQHGGVIFVTAADMAPQAFPPRWV